MEPRGGEVPLWVGLAGKGCGATVPLLLAPEISEDASQLLDSFPSAPPPADDPQ